MAPINKGAICFIDFLLWINQTFRHSNELWSSRNNDFEAGVH